MTTDEVVLAADTPQEPEAAIKERGLKNVAAMRAPLPDEPLFVGGHRPTRAAALAVSLRVRGPAVARS